MLRILMEHRGLVSAIAVARVWSFADLRVPVSAANDIRVLVAANAQRVHFAVSVAVGLLIIHGLEVMLARFNGWPRLLRFIQAAATIRSLWIPVGPL